MSDKSEQGEQKQPQEQHTDWWGDLISAGDQGRLDALAAQQRTWAEQPAETRGNSPLKGIYLTGAGVFWLAKRALAGPEGDADAMATAEMRLRSQQDVVRLFLDVPALRLEGADLNYAHLEGADLFEAHLEDANLTRVFLDMATDVSTAAWIAPKQHIGPQLADVRWGGVNLTAIDWEDITTLRDEQLAKQRQDPNHADKPPKKRQDRIDEYKAAGRAYRLLFVALRNQGLTAPATRYHYRAEIMDRKALWHARQLGRWLFSWLLGTFAGYGDRLGRLFATYGITVSLFALAMLGVALQAGSHLSLDTVRDTLVLSVTSFHGRGVQPPGLHLTDTLATLAGLEAVFGLLIEGLFIAAFTRRVTGG